MIVLFWIEMYDEMHSIKNKSNITVGNLLLISTDIQMLFHVAFKTMAKVHCVLLSTRLHTEKLRLSAKRRATYRRTEVLNAAVVNRISKKYCKGKGFMENVCCLKREQQCILPLF